MATYVLVHGAWHSGELLAPVAERIRGMGHTVHTPTLKGNADGDAKSVGLDEAIGSVTSYFEEFGIQDAVLAGHSYGGMIITGVADRLPAGSIKRLIYWNAFVPNDGESLYSLVPPPFQAMFDSLALDDGSLTLPEPIWRDAFINDADAEMAAAAYARLNPHPYKTFTDPIRLKFNPADMQIGKSYLNFTEDAALPHSMGWHPRMSEKLGLFRLVQGPGSHEVCFTNPELAADKLIEAGRD